MGSCMSISLSTLIWLTNHFSLWEKSRLPSIPTKEKSNIQTLLKTKSDVWIYSFVGASKCVTWLYQKFSKFCSKILSKDRICGWRKLSASFSHPGEMLRKEGDTNAQWISQEDRGSERPHVESQPADRGDHPTEVTEGGVHRCGGDP